LFNVLNKIASYFKKENYHNLDKESYSTVNR